MIAWAAHSLPATDRTFVSSSGGATIQRRFKIGRSNYLLPTVTHHRPFNAKFNTTKWQKFRPVLSSFRPATRHFTPISNGTTIWYRAGIPAEISSPHLRVLKPEATQSAEAFRTSPAPPAMIAGFTSDERPYPWFAIRRWALGNRGCNAAPGSPAAPGRSARSTPPPSPGCATPAGRWSH